jgi:hypothetical protein
MGIVVKADPNKRGELIRVEVPDEDLGQEAPERRRARMAAPKPQSLEQRLATLETKVATLQARGIAQEAP